VEDLLVVCDDANLPVGKLRFRREGSAGGHHGLESIISHLGTDGFQRLRVGIGRRDGEPLVGHVLGKFSKAERAIIDEICIDAARGATVWLVKGIEACMNRFNA
jgi:PTH1 family peptidyl-tRNA hydrolase